MNSKFYTWINLMMAEDCDKVIVALVRAKFNVSADNRAIPVKTERHASTILYLILESDQFKTEKDAIPEARDKIVAALDEAAIKHFGIIVTPPVQCAWHKTNIDMAKAIEERKERLLHSVHLRLVPNNDPGRPAEQEEIPDEPA
jgi:hypothetical protein